MTVLRAHFDGRVLIPDQPADLPTGRCLELQVREVESSATMRESVEAAGDTRDGQFELPTISSSDDEKMMTLDDVKRAEDEQ